MQPLHMSLHSTFVTLSSYERVNSLQKYENWLEYVSDFIFFCMW